MWLMSGPDEEDVPFDDLVDAELEETATPEAGRASETGLALGSDIHDVPPEDPFVVDRVPLDGLDALLVAYLLDLDDVRVDEAHDPDGAVPGHADTETTRPGRVKRP